MKQVAGIWLPDDDMHFSETLPSAPVFDGAATYQLTKLEKALAVVERKRTALDIGAHVGLWSRVLASHFITVDAFEPSPVLRECWKRNLEGRSNVMLHPLALGAKSGDAGYVHTPGNSGNGHISPSGLGQRVDMVRLDSMYFRDIDFIKIDVEGYEYEVLQGAEDVIKFHRPVVLIEQKPNNAEQFGRHRFDASNLLVSWGMHKLWEKAGDCCYGW